MRPARIDVAIPEKNPACHAPGVYEPTPPQARHEVERAPPAAAVHDNFRPLTSCQVVIEELGKILKGDKHRPVNSRDLPLLRPPTVDEEKFAGIQVGFESRLHLPGRDLTGRIEWISRG